MKQKRGRALTRIVIEWGAKALAIAAVCLAASGALAIDAPVASFNLDCRAWDIAADGRIVCATYRLSHFKKYTIERDDIWILDQKGRRKKIVDGRELVKANLPFSFSIQRVKFSPDGQLLTVEMRTSQVLDPAGTTQAGHLVDLMTDKGKEIPIAGTKYSVVQNATNATWLAGGQTVAYLIAKGEGEMLYNVGTVTPSRGIGGTTLDGHFYSTVVWDAARSMGIGIEQDEEMEKPPELVRIDPIHGTEQRLAEIPQYRGEFTVSPQGDKVGYFSDGDTLVIRSLANPADVQTVHCAYGQFAFSPDGGHILLKRGLEKQSNDLVWLSVPSGNLTPILHDVIFGGFKFSPDGRTIVVAQAGTNYLQIYRLE